MHQRHAVLPSISTLLVGAITAAACLVAVGRVPARAAATDDCLTSASTRHDITRIAGIDRWATAACVSRVGHPDGATTVIVARGDQAGGWADALAGTVLSHSADAPILLTAPSTLATAARDEIVRLGATEIIVLGGPGAVSERVMSQLRSLAPTVRRIAGTGRADTAAKVSAEANATGTAFLVNGSRPADALVAGAVAARRGAALLLSDTTFLPDATLEAIAALRIRDVVLVGGSGVIDGQVNQQLRNLLGASHVRRISGPNRQETAASMARAFPVAGGTTYVVAGTDDSLVDAIGASWLAARPGGGPVLYVNRDIITHGTNRLLRLGYFTGKDHVRLVGGNSVIGQETVTELEGRMNEAALGGPTPEVRGMWVHLFDQSLKSPEGIDTVLNAAVAANLNTIIVQTARRHDAYYVTDQIPRTVDPTMPDDLDLLGTLVPAAHARGLQVHAWYSLMPSWHTVYNNLPVQPDHIHEAHGPDSAEPWTTDNNDPAYAFLDPGVPGVQDHVVGMLTDVVRRYDIDAVHLDYLRYSSALAGFHNVSKARFAAHGNGNFDDWRRQQTQELARRIWLEVTAIDPTVMVSMAAIAQGDGPTGPDLMASWKGTKAYADKFQDWVSWLDEGIIDAVFPMAYFRESSHADWYDHWTAFLDSLETDRIVAVGQASYLNTIAQSLSQVDQGLAASDGLIVYAYQQDSSNTPRGTLLAELAARNFADPAPAPLPTFKTSDPNGHALLDGVGDGVVVTASNGTTTRTATGDATGHAGFLGLRPGTWTFRVGSTTRTANVAAARVVSVQM